MKEVSATSEAAQVAAEQAFARRLCSLYDTFDLEASFLIPAASAGWTTKVDYVSNVEIQWGAGLEKVCGLKNGSRTAAVTSNPQR